MARYYTAATADYEAWSPRFNMHFGYWRSGICPLDREAMLHEMNLQALARAQLPRDRPVRAVDLGCGTGATARAAVAHLPNLCVDAVTIVPLQIEFGRHLNAANPRGDAIRMFCGDFTRTELAAGAYDAVYLLESACYDQGPGKDAVICEAYRLLKPGGVLVIVDGMLRRQLGRANPIGRLLFAIYQRWCACWAVPEMAEVPSLTEAMLQAGFEPPIVEDWSLRVLPSVAHAPGLTLRVALTQLLRRSSLAGWRGDHLIGSLLTPLLGLQFRTFGYFAVSARKPVACTARNASLGPACERQTRRETELIKSGE